MAKALPAYIRTLLWDVDPETVDFNTHRLYVMERVMSRGGWDAMKWLRRTYSEAEMKDFLLAKGHLLAPRERAYWSLIAGLERVAERGGGRPRWLP